MSHVSHPRWGDVKSQAGAPGGREGQEKEEQELWQKTSAAAGVGVRSFDSVSPADIFLLSRCPGIPFTSLKSFMSN